MQPNIQRTAIIVEKNQAPGVIANISAILMGQMALACENIYSKDPIIDKSGVRHAGIKHNVVVLAASRNQIAQLSLSLAGVEDVQYIVFGEIGQKLSNSFGEYEEQIAKVTTDATSPMGLVITGEHDLVRKFTRKYSLIK